MRAVAPKLTDKFSSAISVASLSRSGATVSALSVGHGLTTGDYVTIKGAYEGNPATITSADGVATVTTTNDHDLTEIGPHQYNVYPFNQATISGADQGEYNGTFNVASVPNRKSFTYNISGSPASPATGTITLLQDTYNGRYEITVVDDDNFTFQIVGTPETPATGTITAETEARISGAVSIERAVRGYTKQLNGKLWAFVVIGDITISKDRNIFSDATSTMSQQEEWRQRLIEPLSVFVFIPSTSSLSSRLSRDLVEDIRPILYKSLVGVKFPTTLTDETWSMLTPVGDRMSGEASDDSFYVHEFMFERVVDMTYVDTVGPDDNNAFRDFNMTSNIEGGTGDLDFEADLDDEPL